MMRALFALVALAAPAPALAEPSDVAVRVSGAVGALAEITWEAPEIDLVGTLTAHGRFVALVAGYASLDNHTYLADGRALRLAVAGGATVIERWRGAVTLGLDAVAFHADPDVLTDHPGVDQIVRRSKVLPTAGIEISRPVGAATTIGVFARIALRELELFETAGGDRDRARLVLAGAYLDLRIH